MVTPLPTPYLDEILYSVIARLVVRTGWSGRTASRQVFGQPMPCGIDLPGNLNAVAANLGPALTLTADQILSAHTLFPFLAAGASGDTEKAVASILKAESGRRVHALLGIPARTVKAPSELRFCGACREEDLEIRGETYWRRCHQLPGVIACAHHRRMLTGSGIPINHVFAGTYYDATDALRDADEPASPFSPPEIDLAHAVAARCATFLDNEPDAAGRLDVAHFQALARAKGMTGPHGGLDFERLTDCVASAFGNRLLEAMGLQTCTRGNGTYWVRRHFVDFGHAVPVATGVLVEMALLTLPDRTATPGRPRRKVGTPARALSAEETESLRRKWMAAVEDAAEPKVTNARRRRGHLAARLRTWDREWYTSHNAAFRKGRQAADTASVDAQALRAVEEAARAMSLDADGPRISKSAIISRAGIHPGRLAGLPRTSEFLLSHAETVQEHRERKLDCAARRLRSDGRQPTPSSLAEVSGLGYEAVTHPSIRDIVLALCSGAPVVQALRFGRDPLDGDPSEQRPTCKRGRSGRRTPSSEMSMEDASGSRQHAMAPSHGRLHSMVAGSGRIPRRAVSDGS